MENEVISIEKHKMELALRDAQIVKLQNQLNAVLRLLKTGKSERFVSQADITVDQPTLFSLPEVVQDPQAAAPEKEHISYERTKPTPKPHPGRTPLPDHLERREQIIEPELDEAFEWEKIGEQRTEILECDPGNLYVRVIVRPTYKKVVAKAQQAQPQVEQEDQSADIRTASLPDDRPILGSYAGASLLAHLIVAKLVDHLPFYRQIQRWERDHQLTIASSTLNSWFAAVCTLLDPLYKVLRQQILSADYLQADESRLEVLTTVAKDKHGKPLKNKRKIKSKPSRIRRGWMWVAHDVVNQQVLFDFQTGRDKAAADALLKGFAGYLQVDGYASYDHLLKQPAITAVACAAHIRRKFFDARKNDQQRAEHALNIFARIYKIEDYVRTLSVDDRKAYRLQHLQPLLTQFKDWLDNECVKVTPKSSIGRAIRYAQGRYTGLKNVLLDGRLEIDNNLIENTIRPLALGRKNYLFAGSNQGAHRLAMMYSFLGTCKIQGINPYQWLKKVLEVFPLTKPSEYKELLPGNLDLD